MNNFKTGWIALGALVVAAIAGGAYFGLLPSTAPAPAPEAPAPAAAAGPAAPAAPPLPRLADADAWLKTRLPDLSKDVRLEDWLKAGDAIPRLVTAAAQVGAGRVPKDSLIFLAPRGKFSVKKKGAALAIDPKSFKRYDAVADVFGALDAAAAAKLFIEAKPLFQEALDALGDQKRDVQGVFTDAAARLASVPVAAGDVLVKESDKGVVYLYADPALESLSPAQKQLLRMGPRNQAKIQAKLRELAAALGSAPAGR